MCVCVCLAVNDTVSVKAGTALALLESRNTYSSQPASHSRDPGTRNTALGCLFCNLQFTATFFSVTGVKQDLASSGLSNSVC